MIIKLVIAGDSDFNNYELFEHKLDEYLKDLLKPDIQITTYCLEQYNKMLKSYITIKGYESVIDASIFTTDITHTLIEIIKSTADCSIIFWDGINKNTKTMIEKCEWFEHKYRVVNYRHGKEESRETNRAET
jgi:hypothetical protein